MTPIGRHSAMALCVLAAAAVSMVAQARMGGRHVGGALLGLCGSAATISNGLITVEVIVKPTPDQRTMLNEAKKIVEQNAHELAVACTGASRGTMPEQLTASERRLQTALGGVRDIRPALERFYATLSDEQKHEADSLIIFP